MLVTHPLLISKLMQNLGSLAVLCAVSILIISPRVSAIVIAWSWCSKGMVRKLTPVGNAKLLGLLGLNHGSQLCIKYMLHFDLNSDKGGVDLHLHTFVMWASDWRRTEQTLHSRRSPPETEVFFSSLNGDNINAMLRTSLSSPLRIKNPFPTFLQNSRVLPCKSWLRVWIHNFIACGFGFGPTNFPINSRSFSNVIRASNLSGFTLNLMASLRTKKPLKLLSGWAWRTSPIWPLKGLGSPSQI